MNGELILIT